jgi:hypothetical protein
MYQLHSTLSIPIQCTIYITKLETPISLNQWQSTYLLKETQKLYGLKSKIGGVQWHFVIKFWESFSGIAGVANAKWLPSKTVTPYVIEWQSPCFVLRNQKGHSESKIGGAEWHYIIKILVKV